MIVQDLVETKQYLIEETKPGYYVIYEKFEKTDAVLQGKNVKMSEAETEEIVQILHGEQQHSLRNIESYCIGKTYPTVETVLEKVKETHQEIFK